ncbi:34532_t:CDS:1, partial [Racocetra persica]
YLEICNSIYNHDLLEDLSDHLISFQLTEQQLLNIKEMSISSSHPQEIISTLCQNDLSILVISKDIYNACEQLCQQNLASYFSVE